MNGENQNNTNENFMDILNKHKKNLFWRIVLQSAIFIFMGTISLIIINYTTDIFKGPGNIKLLECSVIYLDNCKTKEVCENNNLYWWDDFCHVDKKLEPKPSEYPDYDHYLNLKKIELVTSTPNWVEKVGNQNSAKDRVYKRFSKVTGDIANAYLFVDVSINNKPLLSWNSIYISLRQIINNISYQPQDGHLLKNQSLKVPPSETTKLLYDMKQIPLTSIPYADSNKYENKDWLSLIQKGKTFQLETFLSTMEKGGMINNITIGYECTKETPDCELRPVN